MTNTKKIIAAVLVCVLTALCFAGCGVANNAPGDDAIICVSLVAEDGQIYIPANTAAAVPQTPVTPIETVPVAPVVPSDGVATPVTPAATSAGAQTPATPDANAQPQTPANNNATPAAAPTSKEEVLALYTEAYAKIAAEGKSATLTYNNTTNSPNVLEIGGNLLKTVANSLMGSFLKESTPNTQLSPADVAPKGVTSISIDASKVAEATCTESGGVYEIHIKLNTSQSAPEVNPTANSGGVGSLTDIVMVSDITNAAESFINFEDVKNSYFETEITAKIDPATKHITELYTKCPSIMSFGKVAVKPLGVPSVSNAAIGLTYENRYAISY
ncbi:MAG: hypothetical protein IJ766_07450 [Clostridia bacterium]|nr:hypothetical protein [Clostridia bacterium]